MMPYGDMWRRHRRAFWQCFYPDAIIDYRPIQLAYTHVFLERLLDEPTRLVQLIRLCVRLFTSLDQYSCLTQSLSLYAASILKVTYGIEVKSEDDAYVGMIEAAFEGILEGFVVGRYLVDTMPILRHIQPWIPGAQSPKLWRKWKTAVRKAANVPYRYTKACMVGFVCLVRVQTPDRRSF